MKHISAIILVFPILIETGCNCASQQAEKAEPAATASPATQPAKITEPTAMKPNVHMIEANVESVMILDDVGYRLRLRIVSDIPGPGMEGLTAGQQLEVVPQFVLDEKKAIDLSHERTKKLLTLRHAKSGDSLHGKIFLGEGGTSYLIDLDQK